MNEEWYREHDRAQARMDGKLDQLIALHEEHKVLFEKQDARLDSLEHDRTRAKTLAGVVLSVLTYVMGKLWIVGLFLFVVSCAAPAVSSDRPRWPQSQRPVMVVASDQLSDECLLSVYVAMRFWAAKGITFASDEPVLVEYKGPALGFITISHLPPTESNHAAETLGYVKGRDITRADISFAPGHCTTENAVHELGHAFGLPDVRDENNVMHWKEGHGLQLLAAQLQAIL